MIRLDSRNEQVQQQLAALVSDWKKSGYLQRDDLFVIGCSTSEIAGKQIGTSGSEELAAYLYTAFKQLSIETGIHLAFQCCEHLNRALVVERPTMKQFALEQVSVIPVASAGGSMAAHAYKSLKDPVVVETIQADAGVDIGETMIGMHLKPVVVPLRFITKNIGNARVNAAWTRPKLIGGKRAVYPEK